MCKTKIVFSFDDARGDTYKAVHIAQKYGIKTTVNVTTAYVDGTIKDENRPSPLEPMTIEQIRELSHNSYVELAGHSDNHINEFNDILRGRDKLKMFINEKAAVGFASPSSKINFNENPLDKFKNNDFLYVRVGPKVDKMASM